MVTKAKPKTPATRTLKLDLGGGQNPTEGYQSVDIWEGADHVVDLFQFPWPFKDRSVHEIVSNHLVEHIPHRVPGETRDGFLMFFDECWRILRKGGRVRLTCPYVKNERAFWDPTHTRFIHEMNFWYLNRDWREMQKLDHYPVACHFEVVTVVTDVAQHVQQRHHQAQAEMVRDHWNSVGDLYVELKALK